MCFIKEVLYFMSINYDLLEQDLKRRASSLPYSWGRKQNDDFDKLTRNVYNIPTFNGLMLAYPDTSTDESNYAYNRWFNYHSANAIESFFCESPRVVAESNKYHRTIDFYIDGIPFDHKTTNLPNCFQRRVSEIYNRDFQIELVQWLYRNQSGGQRHHMSNRLFVVVVNRANISSSWKVKSELNILRDSISHYLSDFNDSKLFKMKCTETGNRFLSGIIMVVI